MKLAEQPDGDGNNAVSARVIANLRSSIAVQVKGSEKFEQAYPLNNLPLLVAGDTVACIREEEILRIVELTPRTSVLERADRHTVKPLAANLTHLGIVSANPPKIDTLLIDQFCLAAFRAGVGALIIFNKTDRMTDAERTVTESLAQTYRDIGYSAVLIDTKTDDGMSALMDELPGRSLTLVGASGAGKSSIVQRLLPDRELRIGAVSQATGLGAHTTSVTYWYALPNDGAIIDSPGVRQYSVAHLDEQTVRMGFHDLAEAATQCRFNNCSHTAEPACAVQAALRSGTIASWRYDNYLKLIAD